MSKNNPTDDGTETESYSEIIKKDAERQIVTSVALAPGTPDREGDVLAAENVEKVAHDFMANHRRVDEMHDEIERPEHSIVESFIAPDELEIGDTSVRKGAWVLSLQLGDRAWQKVKKGEYNGFSVGGTGRRYPERERGAGD